MPRTVVGQTVYGNACVLNGTTQYFARSIISTVTDNLTIMGWVRLTANIASNQAIYQNGENDGNGFTLLVRGTGSSNKLRIDLSFVAGLDSTTPITAGSWFHVAARRLAGTWQLFVNGAADGGTISNSPNSPGGNTTIGASRSSGGTASSFLGGNLDEVKFVERALSNAEIAQEYNYGLNINNGAPSATNLKGHYKFDESSGNAADSSGNGLTLTNVGTATYTTGQVMISNVPARTIAGVRIGQLAAGKTEALVDTLSDNSTDTAKWTPFSGSAMVAEANNRLEITLANNIAGSNYAGYVAVDALDLTGSYLKVRVPQAPSLANGQTLFKAQISDASKYITIEQYNGTLKFYYNAGAGVVVVSTKTYNSYDDLWWRIRESGGVVYFDTSADNVKWVNRTYVATPFTITALFAVLTAGTFSNEVAPPKAYFDNYNLPFVMRTPATI